MTDARESADPRISGHASASASLRDTAKWLVGGVTATAAGVFAGSSLTNLGSLDFVEHGARFGLAIGGAVSGFAGLGLILAFAIGALTVESVDFETFCRAKAGNLRWVRGKLDKRHGGSLPGNVADFATLLEKVLASERDDKEASRAFMTEFQRRLPALMAEAGFLSVRRKFAGLTAALWIGAPLALVGFGTFAWAANPPDGKAPAPKPPLLVINQP